MKFAAQSMLVLLSALLAASLHMDVAVAAESLGSLEKTMFQTEYAGDTDEARLARLEAMVFGETQKGTAAARQAKLEAVILKNRPAPQSEQANRPGANTAPPPNESPAPPDATNYPAITQLEQQLLHQDYARDKVTNRLGRLEMKVFGQTYDELPMVDRLDQLTLKVNPNSNLGIEEGVSQGGASGLPNNPKAFLPGSMAVYSQMATLEDKVLGKTYGGELMTNRLARVERKVYGAPHSGDIDSRLAKLMSSTQTASGAPSSGNRLLPNNDWHQTFAPTRPNGQPAGPFPPRAIGSLYGNYSPEFIRMLPPTVQSRVMTPGSGASVATGLGSASPLVTTAAPDAQIGAMPRQQAFPPGYGGGNGVDNTSLQSIAILETQLYGRSFPNMSILQRLGQLEIKVFGKQFPMNSPQVRLSNLLSQSGTMRQSTSPLVQKQSRLGRATNRLMHPFGSDDDFSTIDSSGGIFSQSQSSGQSSW